MGAPRILIVMPETWPRALLRARLRERGYDAVAAPGPNEAMVYPGPESVHGPIRLIVLDQAAMGGDADALGQLFRHHRGASVVLLSFSTGEIPSGPWTAVVRRPFRGGEVMHTIEELLPVSRIGP